MRTHCKVKSAHQAPRSYIIDTPRGILRRNRRFLPPSPVPTSFRWEEEDVPITNKDCEDTTAVKDNSQRKFPASVPDVAPPDIQQTIPYKTRSGRTVRDPSRLIEQDF